jgi:hypothetical protein
MDVKQAVGGQSATGKPKPEMWVVMREQGDIQFKLRHTPRKINRSFGQTKILGVDGKPNLGELETYLGRLTGEYQDLSMALIRPAEKTPFEDIIALMDVFRKQGIQDLGVTPL